jgi:hypothetical protein
MQLDDLLKPNLVTLLGLGIVAAALPEFVPSMRPVLKSAVKIGISLIAESQGEAEAELIQSLAAATLKAIDEELAKPGDEAEHREAVRRKLRHFQHKARKRAESWTADDHERHRCYRRHVARLQSGLVERRQHVGPRRRQIIDEASAALIQDLG